MAYSFTPGSFMLRWLFTAILVLGSYNPTDWSYASWVLAADNPVTPSIAIVGLLLLIGWVVCVRATFLSLGWLGVILGAALFGCFVWLLVDLGWMSLDAPGALAWAALLLISLLLAVGMSWSHVRKRLTGQIDVDDVED